MAFAGPTPGTAAWFPIPLAPERQGPPGPRGMTVLPKAGRPATTPEGAAAVAGSVSAAADAGVVAQRASASAKRRTGEHVVVGRVSDDSASSGASQRALTVGLHAAGERRQTNCSDNEFRIAHVVAPPPERVVMSQHSTASAAPGKQISRECDASAGSRRQFCRPGEKSGPIHKGSGRQSGEGLQRTWAPTWLEADATSKACRAPRARSTATAALPASCAGWCQRAGGHGANTLIRPRPCRRNRHLPRSRNPRHPRRRPAGRTPARS